MRGQDQVTPIDVLHDDALLAIFDFYVADDEWWQLLVHVCRRWRSLVFQSPRRLNLRLFCTDRTPVRKGLDIWPALPLVIRDNILLRSVDNIVAALEHSDRVCQIKLRCLDDGLRWDKVLAILAAMQVPFPELTDLRLSSNDKTLPIIPESFLGGSAPHLQHFELHGVPFLGFPNLLLSSDQLITLILTDIPHSGYISPEAMTALLSMLSSLRILRIEFRSPQSRPDFGLPPRKRSILPSLDEFHFKGDTEYLEALVTRIGTRQLHKLDITLFNHIDFDNSGLTQFINVTPTLSAFDKARVLFGHDVASVELRYRAPIIRIHGLQINISCREPYFQLSSIEQVCNSSLYPFSIVEDLYIERRYWDPVWKNDAIESTLWLQLLYPFTAVKNLYLSKEYVSGIATALQELVGVRITEVLPSLQNIFVRDLESSGPLPDNIGQFITARRLSTGSHPIAIYPW